MLDRVDNPTESLRNDFHRVRQTTLDLVSEIRAEDATVKSMPYVSPTKCHIAHDTWLFESFVLEPCVVPRFYDAYHNLFT